MAKQHVEKINSLCKKLQNPETNLSDIQDFIEDPEVINSEKVFVMACKYAKAEIVEALIEKGANVNSKDRSRMHNGYYKSAIINVIAVSKREIAKILIGNPQINENEAIYAAVFFDLEEEFDNLLKNFKGKDPDIFLTRAFDTLAKQNKYNLMKKLLEAGIYPTISGLLGAMKANNQEYAEILLRYSSKDKEASLIAAVYFGLIDKVKELIADPSIKVNWRNEEKSSALYYACIEQDVEIIRALAAHQELDFFEEDFLKANPLYYIALEQNKQVLGELLNVSNYYMAINSSDDDYHSILYYVLEKNPEEIDREFVAMLVYSGAITTGTSLTTKLPEYKDRDPIEVARKILEQTLEGKEFIEIFKTTIEKKLFNEIRQKKEGSLLYIQHLYIDVNKFFEYNFEGTTRQVNAAQMAFINNHSEAIQLLIDSERADLKVEFDGNTILDIAIAEKMDKVIIAKLVYRGVKANKYNLEEIFPEFKGQDYIEAAKEIICSQKEIDNYYKVISNWNAYSLVDHRLSDTTKEKMEFIERFKHLHERALVITQEQEALTLDENLSKAGDIFDQTKDHSHETNQTITRQENIMAKSSEDTQTALAEVKPKEVMPSINLQTEPPIELKQDTSLNTTKIEKPEESKELDNSNYNKLAIAAIISGILVAGSFLILGILNIIPTLVFAAGVVLGFALVGGGVGTAIYSKSNEPTKTQDVISSQQQGTYIPETTPETKDIVQVSLQ